jgi:hypothetical protein
METFESELMAAIGERLPMESITAAFARFVLTTRALLAAQDPASR